MARISKIAPGLFVVAISVTRSPTGATEAVTTNRWGMQAVFEIQAMKREGG